MSTIEDYLIWLCQSQNLSININKQTYRGFYKITLGSVAFDRKVLIGIINDKDQIIIPFKYEEIQFIDINDKITVKQNGKWKIIDRAGFEYGVSLDYDSVGVCSEELIAVKKNDKWGYIDTMGNQIISCIYDEVDLFKDGRGKVGYKFIYPKTRYFKEEVREYGFIDRTGKEIIPLIYNNVCSFKDGIAKVEKKNRDVEESGFIDKMGNIVIPFITLNDEFIKKIGFLDRTKRPIYTFAHTYIFTEGLLGHGKENRFGYLNKENKEIIPYAYESVTPFRDGFARVKKNGKWGVIDKTNKQIVDFSYDEIDSFRGGISTVKIGNKYGCINILGYQIVACMYDEVGAWINGISIVKKNNKRGLINILGMELTPFIYDEISRYSENLILYKKDRKWGVMSCQGRQITNPKYTHISVLVNHSAIVSIESSLGQITKGIINKEGKEILSPIYEYIFFNSNDNSYYLKKDDKYAVFYNEKLFLSFIYTEQKDIFIAWKLQRDILLNKSNNREIKDICINNDGNISYTTENNLLLRINIMTGLIYEKENEIDWIEFLDKCKKEIKESYQSFLSTNSMYMLFDRYTKTREDGTYNEERNWLKRWFATSPQLFSFNFLENYQDYISWYYVWKECQCSDIFIRNFIHKVRWKVISKHQRLSEQFIDDYADKIDWKLASWLQSIPERLIDKFSDKVDWDRISIYQNLSEDFIERNILQLNWYKIQIHQNLSEKFIEKMADKIDWKEISKYQNLSEDFIERNKEKVHWENIFTWQNISNEFINKYLDKAPYYAIMYNVLDKDVINQYRFSPYNESWLYLDKNTKKEKLEKHFREFECFDDYFLAYKEIRHDGYDIINFRDKFLPNQTYVSKASPLANNSEYLKGFEVTAKQFIRYERFFTGNNIYSKSVMCKIYYEDVMNIVENKGFMQTFVRCSKIHFLE